MSESTPYPGSPSLAPEAREKVLQTYRHTLDLARAGKNDEALLGCDFILKMDPRFGPAKKLLDAMRGMSSGTLVDLSDPDLLVPPVPSPASAAAAEAPAAAPLSTAAPAEPPADPFDFGPDAKDQIAGAQAPADPFATPPPRRAVSAPSAAPPSPPVPAPVPPAPVAAPPDLAPATFGGGLDDLSFDQPLDFGFAPAAAPAAAPPVAEAGLPQFDPFSSPASGFEGPFGAPVPPVPPTTSAGPAGPAESPVDAAGLGGPADPFAQVHPAPASPAPVEPPSPGGKIVLFPTPGPSGSDPRITQFLKQGDEAMSRGQVQEAIDLWSRVFLIDLSNEEASRRIDAAREKQAQLAQTIDVLLAEGIQLYEKADYISARGKFLDVLALQESDSTARSYLNQIEGVLAQQTTGVPFRETPAPGIEVASPFGPPSTALDAGLAAGPVSPLEEGEAGPFGPASRTPSLADVRLPSGVAAPPRKVRIDARLLLAGVAALALLVAGGAWLLLRGRAAPSPASVDSGTSAKGSPAAEPVARAQALFDKGKADEALQLLVAVPDADPRHAEALALIDRIKSSAAPTPSSAPPSAAALDELRVAGLAAVRSSRYIEAVKALDPVVKARPDDQEAGQGLLRAREQLAALSSAIRAFNEQDYESAVKLLWDLRKRDPRNQDVEEYLFKAYYNDGVQALQGGNMKRATESFGEAAQLRPSDTQAQRHLRFARRYKGGPTDLLSRIYAKHVSPRA